MTEPASPEIAALRAELEARLDAVRAEFVAKLTDAEARLGERIAAEIAAEKRARTEQIEALMGRFDGRFVNIEQGVVTGARAVEVLADRIGSIEQEQEHQGHEQEHQGSLLRSVGVALDSLLKANDLDAVEGLVPK